MEMMKVNALIEEMNYKIAENKMAFREELARLKLDLVAPPQRTTSKHNLSIPTLPKRLKINSNHDSERLLQGPSLYYEIPEKQTRDLIQG